MKTQVARIRTIAILGLLLAAGMLTFLGCSAQGDREAAGGEDVQTVNVAFSPGGVLSYYDDSNELTGFEIELLREVDKRLPQYEFEYQQIEYKSFFPSLKTGKVDLVTANLRRNDERESYLHTYRGYNTWWNVLIVLEDNTTIKGIEDLEGKRVGTSQGTLSATYMENYISETGKDIELVYSTDSTNDLVTGKIDTFIGPDYFVALLNEQFEQEGISFKAVGDSIGTNTGVEKDKNVYWFLADGKEQLRDDISEAVYEIRSDGTLSKLFIEFFGYDRVDTIDVSEEEKHIRELGK
ncbi:MAG: transporter substrate-binding domain-containing protein [Coriobacteriales bacterium]|jgi:L-cystine transport system substrate-binding protein|nr:transporter substrate-binding domain-containing protein [Coriobacteriales bacterium]